MKKSLHSNLLKKPLEEADLKVYKTKKEEEVKQWILKMLRDDGHGHHYPKFAKRFEDFLFQIVRQPTNEADDPEAYWFTAATNFEMRTIWIGEGFLKDESLLYQVSVLMRHELLHNLLMHEIRMMHKIGEKSWAHFQYSQSIQSLLNIIDDYEISNDIDDDHPGGYSKEDKIIVKNMTLNGKVIGGLVTEFDRPDWARMSVEEMYDAMTQEIAAIKAGMAKSLRNYLGQYIPDSKDPLRREIASAKAKYSDITSPSAIHMPIGDFINSRLYKRYPKVIQDVISQLYKALVLEPDSSYEMANFDSYLNQIANSDLMEVITLLSPQNKTIVELHTPEEKQLAIEVLKNIRDFDWAAEWHKRVVNGLANKTTYSDADIQTILDALENE